MTGDMGEHFNDLRDYRRAMRERFGQPCADCVRLLPKACPSILLPGQRCKIKGHGRDQRTRLPDDTNPWETTK